MPSDLPASVPTAAIPYFRTIAFVTGGAVTLVVLLILSYLARELLI